MCCLLEMARNTRTEFSEEQSSPPQSSSSQMGHMCPCCCRHPNAVADPPVFLDICVATLSIAFAVFFTVARVLVMPAS